MDLGVSQLPEQEITNSVFAAGANQKIRVLIPCGKQLSRKAIFVDCLWINHSRGCFFGETLGRSNQFATASVIGADVEMNSVVLGRSLHGVVDQVLQFFWKPIEITKEANPHLFFLQ